MISSQDILKDPSLVLVLHPALDVVALSDSRFQVRGLNDNLTFDDATGLAETLFSHCNGSTQVGEILGYIDDDKQKEDFARIVAKLCSRGMLIKASEAFRGDLFLQQVDLLRRQVTGRAVNFENFCYRPFSDIGVSDLPSVTVNLFGKGVLFNTAASLLANWGLKIAPNPGADHVSPQRSIALICSDVDDPVDMLRHNAELVRADMPALYACLREYVVRVGPLVVPGESACFECYDRRVRSLLSHADEFEAFVKNNHARGPSETAPMMAGWLGGILAASTLVKFVCGVPHHAIVGSIVELNVISNKTSVSSVLKLPRCRVCGAGTADHAPVAVRSRR